jgi:hypothetical protein
MSYKRLVVLAFLAAVFSIGSLPAQAACSGATCPLVGGVVRYQIGNGLPFPASALLLGQPTGQLNTSMTAMGLILPLPGAVVSQGSTAPRSIMMPPSQLSAPQLPFTIPLFSANPLAFQLKTSIGFLFPSTLVTFSASGRVGPSTAAWCIDADPPAVPTGTPIGGFNPGCLGPNTTASLGTTFTSGLLRYTRTANQFGGVARAARPDGGTADIAINIAGIPALPCTLCTFGVQQIGSRFDQRCWNHHQRDRPDGHEQPVDLGGQHDVGRSLDDRHGHRVVPDSGAARGLHDHGHRSANAWR